jgi:acetoin utilization deacetylase AcuC-like enzyme
MTLPLVVHDARFQEHRPPEGHAESPARLQAVEAALPGRGERCLSIEPRPATDEEIAAIHAPAYLRAIDAQAGRSVQLDADTYLSARSVEVARLAAGGTIDLALRIARGEATSGFALVRPPGHHAEHSRAMGFCLFNHVALAARALQREAGLERIAIVDWDVHHGNGTQHLFESDRDVLYLSTHQFPFYPGTGSLAERGRGAGEGATVNLPLPAGCGDAEYLPVFESVVVPCLLDFAPQMILVSAGFDAHLRDPLAQMRVSTDGYRQIVRAIRAVAEERCGGRLLLALEGGYDTDALADCVGTALDELAAPVTASVTPAASAAGGELVRIFRECHGGAYPSLA